MEANPLLKIYVLIYGAEKGFLRFTFHPVRVVKVMHLILLSGLIYWLTRSAVCGSYGIMPPLAVGIFLLALSNVLAVINNMMIYAEYVLEKAIQKRI